MEQLENALARAENAPVEQPGEIVRIAGAIDTTSSTDILNFGTDFEGALSDVTNNVLDKALSKDTVPGHAHLSEIKMVASGFSVAGLKENRGFISRLFDNTKREPTKFINNFNNTRQRIDIISRKLEDEVNELQLGWSPRTSCSSRASISSARSTCT